MRTITKAALISLSAIIVVLAANVVMVHRGLSAVLSKDPRNEGIRAFAYYRYFLLPSSVVLDLRWVPADKSMADITRVLLQFSEAQKDHHYDEVTLAYRGEPRFTLEGVYFQRLGREFETQNPIYTIRTLPENVHLPNGEHAFGKWTGGVLGVFAKQMEDHQEFHRRWYLQAILDESSRVVRPQ